MLDRAGELIAAFRPTDLASPPGWAVAVVLAILVLVYLFSASRRRANGRTGVLSRIVAVLIAALAGWWFLDQKEAMEWQLNALSNAGLLSRFVGMLTDSRSFMSFPRHEYFRRVLCNLIGDDMEKGLLPNKNELIGPMIKNICFVQAFKRGFFLFIFYLQKKC